MSKRAVSGPLAQTPARVPDWVPLWTPPLVQLCHEVNREPAQGVELSRGVLAACGARRPPIGPPEGMAWRVRMETSSRSVCTFCQLF